ncbi:MAG: hypothetical protein K9G10_03470 [Rhodoluna sp.]|nr:hypothetical protein [Rhodoluna sp.]
MNTPDELDARLRKADPANKAKTEPLSAEILAAASKSKLRLGLTQRFELLSAKARGFALGGLVSGTAAILAVAIVVNPIQTPLIQLAASYQGPSNGSGSMSEASDDKLMSMPFFSYDYVAGPNLSNESGSGQIYKLVRTGTPESILQKVSRLFDVQGSVKKFPDFSEANPGYFFGESDDPWGIDNQNPIVSVWWSGTASWYYSNPSDSSISSSCSSMDAEGFCEEWIEPVATPELLPSKSEAIAKALEVFNATGLAVTESDLRVDMSEWGVSVSAAMAVDNQPTSIEWYIGWGPDGEISYAQGHSVVAQAVGTYNTISPVQAMERLDQWIWYGSPPSYLYEKYPAIYSDMSVRNEPLVDPEVSETEVIAEPIEPSPSETASAVPEPTETEPAPVEPQVVTLTIVRAESALLGIWDAAGDVWLVPGWVMFNDEGWWSTVISLIEGIIALPDPGMFDVEPLPAEDSSVGN